MENGVCVLVSVVILIVFLHDLWLFIRSSKIQSDSVDATREKWGKRMNDRSKLNKRPSESREVCLAGT